MESFVPSLYSLIEQFISKIQERTDLLIFYNKMRNSF